ncbi:hypothetical protein B0H12DRAFT_1109069 [Mycena haematopus]|nr:hypothetical protein B0H12DRAFT_1109069 [Mycena haematopus]
MADNCDIDPACFECLCCCFDPNCVDCELDCLICCSSDPTTAAHCFDYFTNPFVVLERMHSKCA